MGINLWFNPQISEHWPKYNPFRSRFILNWLIRPGIASTLIANDGIAQEWITSNDETNLRILKLIGKIKRLSTSNNRKIFFIEKLFNINESNSIFLKSLYSYLQYHWWPIILRVI